MKKKIFQKILLLFKDSEVFRYLGQDHSVEISLDNINYDNSSVTQIIKDFHEQYEKEFTYRLENQVDMIQFHLVAFCKK